MANQINDSFRTYGRHLRLRTAVVYGGTPIRAQIRALNHGVHVLVATPGRLLDLMNQRHVRLDGVETFILDEADRMLDMGFGPQIRQVAHPKYGMPGNGKDRPGSRQTLMFSATFPKDIQKLAAELLRDHVFIAVGRVGSTTELITQKVTLVQEQFKADFLVSFLKEVLAASSTS